MQRIERYGVIALVFLLVTVAAVSFWGDGAKGKKGEQTARNEPTAAERAPSVPARQEPQRPAGKSVARNDTKAPLPLDREAEGARGAESNESRGLAGMVALDPAPPEATEPPANAARDEERRGDARRDREATPASEPASAAPPRDVKKAPQDREGRLDPAEMELVGVQPAPRATTVEYVVKAGDTLSGIALATLGSTKRWPEIAALNAGLDPSTLQSGRTILLPKGAVFPVRGGTAGAKEKSAGGAAAPEQRNAPAATYVVRSGDLLSTIAQRELGAASRWREIVELNPGVDPKRLLVGTVLKLPSGAGSARPTTLAKAAPERQAAREKEFKVR